MTKNEQPCQLCLRRDFCCIEGKDEMALKFCADRIDNESDNELSRFLSGKKAEVPFRYILPGELFPFGGEIGMRISGANKRNMVWLDNGETDYLDPDDFVFATIAFIIEDEKDINQIFAEECKNEN